VIVDYKTGEKTKKDQQQVLKYQKTLEKMGYKVEALILVYIESSVELVYVTKN
jgi:RecB family exonuclease